MRYSAPRSRALALNALAILLAISGLAYLTQRGHVSNADFIPPSGTRVHWEGKDWFLLGANVPWFSWNNDFGGGSNGGVSSPGVNAAVDAKFQEAQDAGLTTIRWWVMEGGAPQIARDANGVPNGINPAIYPDLDAAIALAKKHNLYLDFVLFNGTDGIPPAWFSEPSRTALANVLEPLFAHYKDEKQILAWESFNEPEYQMWNGNVPADKAVATDAAIAQAAHAQGGADFTVGSASVAGLAYWKGDVDFYSPHWYQSTMGSGVHCAACFDSVTAVRSSAGIADTKPIVIGETDLSRGFGSATTVSALLRMFYDKGFAGVWGWSLFPDHTGDGIPVNLSEAKVFSQSVTDIGPRPAAVSPCLALAMEYGKTGHLDRSAIDLQIKDVGGSASLKDLIGLASQADGRLDLPGSGFDLAQPHDLYLSVPGYLRRKLGSAQIGADACLGLDVAHSLRAGDFNSDNAITLSDLVLAIRAFNGEGTAVTQEVFGGAPDLGELVGVIRNLNLYPHGE